MKSIVLNTALVLALLPAAALAQQKAQGMGAMDSAAKSAARASHAASGVVKKVNTQAGVITLAHGPVNSLNWPPMTMGFKVRDKALLAKLKEGQKVNVEFVQEGDDYVVTTLK